MPARRATAILALGLAAACATPGQVRRVETRIAVMETENRRADSAHTAELGRIRASLERLTDGFNVFATATGRTLDSLKQNDRGLAFDILDLNKQLYALQAVVNGNAADAAKARAAILALDNALQQRGTPNDTVAGSSTVPTPLDEQLMDQAQKSITLGALGEGRNNLHQLVQTYPNSPLAPKALLELGRTFVSGQAQPDSQRFYFSEVYRLYPKATEAPVAIYKLAQLADAQANKRQARTWFQKLVDEFGKDPLADLARDWLQKNP